MVWYEQQHHVRWVLMHFKDFCFCALTGKWWWTFWTWLCWKIWSTSIWCWAFPLRSTRMLHFSHCNRFIYSNWSIQRCATDSSRFCQPRWRASAAVYVQSNWNMIWRCISGRYRHRNCGWCSGRLGITCFSSRIERLCASQSAHCLSGRRHIHRFREIW